jgi:hypothetical protein
MCRLIATAFAMIVILLFQGCAQDTTPESGPITGGHSNITFSGYTRAGVIFSGLSNLTRVMPRISQPTSDFFDQ